MSKEHHFRSYLSNFLANHVLCLYVYISVNKTKAEKHPANMERRYILNRYFIS